MDDEKEAALVALGIFVPIAPDDPDADDYDYIVDGRRYHNPDCLYSIVLEEEISVDIRNNGENIDDYWAQAWHTGFCDFRRSNFDVYKGRYRKIFPTRYRLKDFVFTKSLRRVLKKNRDLRTVIRPLRITPEKSALHAYYHYLRHGETPRKSLLEVYDYTVYYPSKLTELCVFKKDKLVACSIFEVGNRAMVSNSAFWDLNESARSLGTFTILLEVEYARQHGIELYYLGHYYRQNPNYQYKTRFHGLELYDWDNGRWIDFKNPEVAEMLKQKLPRHKD
jgi:arginine-tRNA-protein transferase